MKTKLKYVYVFFINLRCFDTTDTKSFAVLIYMATRYLKICKSDTKHCMPKIFVSSIQTVRYL